MENITGLRSDLDFGFIDRNLESTRLFDPHLLSNSEERTMLSALREELAQCTTFRFSVAFISSSGLAMLKQALLDFKGTGTIITSRYLDFNNPDVFRELLLLQNVNVLIYDVPNSGFHAKGYVFKRPPFVTAIVGSSNLTDAALAANHEWNVKFSAHDDGDIAYQIDAAIKHQESRAIPLTEEWIVEYEKTRVPRLLASAMSFAGDPLKSGVRVEPNSMQKTALESLDDIRQKGESKAVIVSATGTGKTILAALAVRDFQPERMLFVVHREQILDKAIEEFQKVLDAPLSEFGKYSGQHKQIGGKYLFATIQSLTNTDNLKNFSPDEFDFIIVDEVHRSGAKSYISLINYFQPKFLLGLTATPERTDGFNVFELFDYNVPYEIRLQSALENKMLVPFHYFGVTDFVNDKNETITETSQLARLVSQERVQFVVEKLRQYGLPNDVRGLMFCSRKDEAKELTVLLNSANLNGRLLRTETLTGDDSISHRENTVRRLENGELDYILTVDIFNEGIDIPSVNQIVMLRSTQSSIIFTQQLGRGLRKFEGKDHLRVIDFIGNYANNYLIPIALYGDQSRDKDKTRKNIIESAKRGVVSGVSSVNFDPIAQQRILASLAKARLVGKEQFKRDILYLKDRLNHIPNLFDFARFNTVDPVVIATKYQNYWSLLYSLKFTEQAPTDQESGYLNFISNELLNGKRSQELLILNSLLHDRKLSSIETQDVVQAAGARSDESTVESALRVLDFRFLKKNQIHKYGGVPPVERMGDEVRLSPAFERLYFDGREEFRAHVDDLVRTGLFLARERHSWNGELIVGNRYSRRDVCRLLNWESNLESTVYGYKFDAETRTCPIFVTYHKDANIDASVSYGDKFLSPGLLRWFTKSKRRIDSPEIQPILSNQGKLLVFVKKDDGEGTDFYYLGPATASNPLQEKMPDKSGKPLDVVSMDLTLQHEVEQALFDYLESAPLKPSSP